MLKSNVLGLYRSHLNKDVTAGRCRSDLRQERLQADAVVARRPGADKDMHVETNCTLQRL